MKLKKGMYVRTKKGEIHKLLDTEIEIRYRFDTGIDFPYLYNGNYDNQITKASHNIIDIIEVGDYVNGKEVINKDGKYGGIKCLNNNFYWRYEIETIVTHEQFKQMEYKVVE